MYSKPTAGVKVIRGFYQLHSAINHLVQIHGPTGTDAWDSIRDNLSIYDPDRQLTVSEMSGYVVYRQPGIKYQDWLRAVVCSPMAPGGVPGLLTRASPAQKGDIPGSPTITPSHGLTPGIENGTAALSPQPDVRPNTTETGGAASEAGSEETPSSTRSREESMAATQTQKERLETGSPVKPSLGAQSTGSQTPVRLGKDLVPHMETNMAPLRISRVEATEPGHVPRSLQVVRSIVQRVKALGTHVLIATKLTPVGKGQSTWFSDSGVSITQFTPKEAERYQKSMVRIGQVNAACQSATKALDIPMVLYKLKGISVVDPRTGQRSKPIDTYVLLCKFVPDHSRSCSGTQHHSRPSALV